MTDDLPRAAIEKLPVYMPGKQVEDVVKEFGIKEVVKLASNENPFGPSPKAVESIIKNLNSISVYPDQHHSLLRENLAKKWELSKDNFIVGNGSDEIMLLLAQVFLSAGDEVVVSRNTFSVYEFVSEIMDAELVFVDLLNNAYDLEAVKRAVTEKTKLIFLCNPNNPTGTYFNKKQLADLVKGLPKNVITVIDEAYADFADSDDFPAGTDLIKEGKNIVVLRTFSKVYGLAGLRVGYGIARPQIIKYLFMAKLPFNVNRLALIAAGAALEDGEFIEQTLANNREGKAFISGELKKMGLKHLKSQANFIFIDLGRDSGPVFMDMMRHGVIIRPLASFGFPKAIRVSIGTMRQNERFIEALKKVI
ncbi:MAG: histidinol-phosphate transaminase [Candidatus Saganbacteria bacterium]|nr:histidinol-phosphate transaminase [Candidatus Saganbacteria bacterium]